MTTTTSPSRGRADSPAADQLAIPVDTAVHPSADSLGLRLRVQHPVVGVCVVAVEGELDMLTTPLLEACIREQLAAVPTHLILDLEGVRFLGSSGLNCLLQARELAQQTTGVQLHLAGLRRRVMRSLDVTGLLERFDTYPCLADALTALSDATEVRICTGQVGLVSVIGRLDDTGLAQLRTRLRAQVDTDAQYLVINLAGVISCDYRLFDVLASTHQLLAARQGWMRLVGVGPAVSNALDEATPAQCLLVEQASEWASRDE